MRYNIVKVSKISKEDVSGPLILAPFNHFSIAAYHILTEKYGIQGDAFCDNDAAVHGKVYKGAEVCAFDMAYKNNPDAAVVICSIKHRDVLEKQVRDIGFKRVLYLDQIADKNAYRDVLESEVIDYEGLPPRIADYLRDPVQLVFLHNGFFDNEELLIIENFNIKITEKCTLKCKNCASLMQYYTNPKHQSLKKTKDTLDALLTKVDYIRYAAIIGGEPFLYPELSSVIKHLGSKIQVGFKEVVTNGTLIPNGEVLKALKETKTSVTCSDYGGLSRKKDELSSIMMENAIPFTMPENLEWIVCRKPIPKMSEADANNIFGKCFDFCASIMNGRLYYCNFIAAAGVLEAVPDNKADYIELLSDDITGQDIFDYLKRETPLPACYYCSGFTKDGKKVLPGEQTEKPVGYKKYYE